MSSSPRSWRRAGTALRVWRSRQWTVAGAGAAATAVLVGVPTDVVPNPLFGRSVPVQWWNYPAPADTAVLAGIVLTTYVRRPSSSPKPHAADGGRLGAIGGVLSFFAVGSLGAGMPGSGDHFGRGSALRSWSGPRTNRCCTTCSPGDPIG